jgi:hypothetical protein
MPKIMHKTKILKLLELFYFYNTQFPTQPSFQFFEISANPIPRIADIGNRPPVQILWISNKLKGRQNSPWY